MANFYLSVEAEKTCEDVHGTQYAVSCWDDFFGGPCKIVLVTVKTGQDPLVAINRAIDREDDDPVQFVSASD